MGDAASPRLTFRPADRLTHAREFQAVFAEKMRKASGPIAIFVRPNTLPHPRLGLSIGKPVGNAVARNTLKRRLREAFRLGRHAYPAHAAGSYDVVISARAHAPLRLAAYIDLLTRLVDLAHRDLAKRLDRKGEKGPEGAGDVR